MGRCCRHLQILEKRGVGCEMKKYMDINIIDDDEDLNLRRERFKEELKREFEEIFNTE